MRGSTRCIRRGIDSRVWIGLDFDSQARARAAIHPSRSDLRGVGAASGVLIDPRRRAGVPKYSDFTADAHVQDRLPSMFENSVLDRQPSDGALLNHVI